MQIPNCGSNVHICAEGDPYGCWRVNSNVFGTVLGKKLLFKMSVWVSVAMTTKINNSSHTSPHAYLFLQDNSSCSWVLIMCQGLFENFILQVSNGRLWEFKYHAFVSKTGRGRFGCLITLTLCCYSKTDSYLKHKEIRKQSLRLMYPWNTLCISKLRWFSGTKVRQWKGSCLLTFTSF